MKEKLSFTKTDIVFTIACIVFLMMNIGAIGTGGRHRAKNIACSANLRQLGIAFQMYANDYENSLPPGLFVECRLVPGGQWVDVLRPYYQDPNLLFCPLATKVRFIPPTAFTPGPGRWLGAFSAWGMYDRNLILGSWGSTVEPGHKTAGSYGINSHCSNPDNRTRAPRSNEWSARYWGHLTMGNSDEVPFLFDSLNFDCNVRIEDDPPEISGQFAGSVPDQTSKGGPDGIRNVCLDRHGEAVNIVYVAGNVGKVNLKCLWTLRWNKGYRRELLTLGREALPNWTDTTHWMYGMKSCVPEYLRE